MKKEMHQRFFTVYQENGWAIHDSVYISLTLDTLGNFVLGSSKKIEGQYLKKVIESWKEMDFTCFVNRSIKYHPDDFLLFIIYTPYKIIVEPE